MKRADLVGQVFGGWRVLEPAPGKGLGAWWLCQCECGTRRSVPARSLVHKKSFCCGCRNRKDLTGQRFGCWVALSRIPGRLGKPSRWYTRCDCGWRAKVVTSVLLAGKSRSCGSCSKKGHSQLLVAAE